MQIDISKRASLIFIFFGLLGAKCVGFNGVVDDLMLLTVGAIVGKEVLQDGEKQ